MQEVVLNHVPERPGFLIIAAPAPDPIVFRHGDLHVVDVAAVPNRLEECVGEPEGEDVLNGLFSEIVVYPVDLGFLEILGEQQVQFTGRIEVMAERFFHNDSRMLAAQVQFCARKPLAMDLIMLGGKAI